MKKSRFTDSQIMEALKRAEAGQAVPELCRALGISVATFYKWRSKFGGMAHACQLLLDTSVPDAALRTTLLEKIPRDTLTRALEGVNALIRPADNVYFRELDARYRAVRRYLPALVEHVRFGANAEGKPVVAAFEWLQASRPTFSRHRS